MLFPFNVLPAIFLRKCWFICSLIFWFCFQTSLMRLISAIRLLVCWACLSCNIRYTRALTEGSSASFGTFTKRWGLDLIHKKNQKKISKIYNCLSHQIAWEIMLLLVNNLQGKNITESQNRRNFESVRVICNLNSCHNFALVLHENALFFSQSEARNFFMYTPPVFSFINIWCIPFLLAFLLDFSYFKN